MNIHYFQHDPSENLGEIEAWARRQGHTLSATHWYRGDLPPDLQTVDWLILMGGAMNIYEHRNYPWLVTEKEFLARAIADGKIVLGICLGAQLIADALGGKVFQNPEVEIGWFPVRFRLDSLQAVPLFAQFPPSLTPLHWHGDTFSLPPGAIKVAESDGCQLQAFAMGDRVVGLQFHLEVGGREVDLFLENQHGDLGSARFIQDRDQIGQGAKIHLGPCHQALEQLLNALGNR